MSELAVRTEVIDDVASRLDLRTPNRDALETIAYTSSQHFDVDGLPPPLEAVIDSATGMGKTYVMAAALEYFALSDGVRNFAIIAPGRTILEKTIDNFTPGHAKSLLAGMSTKPLVITSENFATPVIREAMDDETVVKLFVFTVQAITQPTTKVGRKTHKFQEGLGSGLYEYLQSAPDLVVFADEHHTYYGKAFSAAVRDLSPRILLGLTATPHRSTPKDQVIFRYPLSAAIAEQYVKTPVLVGRTDDREDAQTKLADGVALLDLKQQAVDAYCKNAGVEPIHPVMLVIAQTIEDADEYGSILTSHEFQAGKYASAVLVVHSDAPDDALAALAKVEDADSPVRVIISVGMLKEGWDVKNVYVIASMRSSVSEILTEQTLGRGLRLPFGKYTGIEFLDTLEVVAHEKYEALLRKAGVINEAFVDHRTRAVLRRNAQGELVSVSESLEVAPVVIVKPGVSPDELDDAVEAGRPVVTSVGERTGHVKEEALQMQVAIAPRAGTPPIIVPRLRQSQIESDFTLADITDLTPFRLLGERISADPEESLRRTVVGARIIEGLDGMKRTELVTSQAADRVKAQQGRLPLEDAREILTATLINAPMIPARKEQKAMARPIIEAFIQGLGPKAEAVLGGYLERAAARLIQQVATEQRKVAPKPTFHEVVELKQLGGVRTNNRSISTDRIGAFSKRSAYEGWKRSIYPIEWFDSSTERTFANVVDDASLVDRWARLQIGDLPILWRSDGREYNADFIVIEKDGTHWVIEVKMDKELTSEEVGGKREAAKKWVNYVNADEKVDSTWQYGLLSETDIAQSRGSWEALKALGRG